MNLERFYCGKVVVITGSARGIGREAARQALSAGARVVLNGRDAAVLEDTRVELGAAESLVAVTADVSTPEGARHLIGQTMQTWGRLDVLVNNAGLSMRGAFGDLSGATVRTMVDANFLSAVWTTQAALPALRASNGCVVFVSSLAGLRGFPGVSLYSAAKMALTALHQSLRAEESPAIRSCLVHLAFTENDTGKTTLGADGRPFQHHRTWSMTQTRTAAALLKAAARGRNKTILTATGWALSLGQSIFPFLVDSLVKASGGKIHSVRRSP